MLLADVVNMDFELQELKKKYIPQYVKGQITYKECAALCKITVNSVYTIAKRYKLKGDKAFVHQFKNKRSNHCKFTRKEEKEIITLYKKYGDSNFGGFLEYLNYWLVLKSHNTEEKLIKKWAIYFKNHKINYMTLKRLLNRNGLKSPKTRIKHKQHNKSRPRKENAGDMLQFDATPFQWFKWCGDKNYYALHGNIDDATNTICGLYLCKNECRLGYLEVCRQTFLNYGVPKSAYTDMSSSFFVQPRKTDKTIEELMQERKKSNTTWTRLCAELNIKSIIAYSPQAKGRIERMWQTIQGQLPYLFNVYKINNIEKANEFLSQYIEFFNFRYSRKTKGSSFSPLKNINDLDYLLSVRIPKKTKRYGVFHFHGYEFILKSDLCSYRNFELCLSEKFGIKARINGKFYNVELNEPLCDIVGDAMPIVEKELISKYMTNNSKCFSA